jgi:hypothetical protein
MQVFVRCSLKSREMFSRRKGWDVLLDIQLSFHPPLVKNPEPDWLADHVGDHFDALRLFHEACWAWASFQAQRKQPYASVRWGHTIASKADLYDYAIDCRRQALLNGFFLLTAEQLDELASLPDLSANQEEIPQHFLAQEELNELLRVEFAIQKKRACEDGNRYTPTSFLTDLPRIFRGYYSAQRLRPQPVMIPTPFAFKRFDPTKIPALPCRLCEKPVFISYAPCFSSF